MEIVKIVVNLLAKDDPKKWKPVTKIELNLKYPPIRSIYDQVNTWRHSPFMRLAKKQAMENKAGVNQSPIKPFMKMSSGIHACSALVQMFRFRRRKVLR